MKINQLLESQEQLDELNMQQVGQGLAKGAGAVSKGASAVAGGLAGMWDQAKAGFQAGRGAVNGTAPAATQLPAAAPAAPATAGATATAPAQTNAPATPAVDPKAAAQAKMNTKQVMALWSTLPPQTKKAVLTRLTADTKATPASAPAVDATTPPPVAPATTPAAPEAEVPTAVPGKKVRVKTGGKKPAVAPEPTEQDKTIAAMKQQRAGGYNENYKFESKFLGIMI